ncbi:MAG: tyrosine-protein phosphatase [Campylobacterota bacterium]|nr:tyrosine-protein phosphatase [Campylobacterota bacterium]
MRTDFNLKSFWGRVYAWLYAMIVEHNVINLLRLNFHEVSTKQKGEAYRSAQPTMEQLKRYSKKYGIKTIINLKGHNPKGAYFLFEKEQCEKLGLKLVNIGIKSRGIPKSEQIAEAKKIFEEVEYPIWMHCKAGSDRTGIYANLYQYFREKIVIKDTNQLAFFPFGHVKQSKAGQVDFYFEKFEEYEKENPDAEFYDWTQNIANRSELEKEFHSSKIADFINDKILRRQ